MIGCASLSTDLMQAAENNYELIRRLMAAASLILSLPYDVMLEVQVGLKPVPLGCTEGRRNEGQLSTC